MININMYNIIYILLIQDIISLSLPNRIKKKQNDLLLIKFE